MSTFARVSVEPNFKDEIRTILDQIITCPHYQGTLVAQDEAMIFIELPQSLDLDDLRHWIGVLIQGRWYEVIEIPEESIRILFW